MPAFGGVHAVAPILVLRTLAAPMCGNEGAMIGQRRLQKSPPALPPAPVLGRCRRTGSMLADKQENKKPANGFRP